MAAPSLTSTHLRPSSGNSGTGDPVLLANIKTYYSLDEPAYSGGTNDAGTARYLIRFELTNVGVVRDPMPTDWVFTSSTDRDEELGLVNAAISAQLSS